MAAGAISCALVPITFTGPLCVRRGCRRPAYRDRLCGRCWRLARFFGKDLQMFAYEPLDGYQDDHDAVGLPWERWEKVQARGGDVADLFPTPPSTRSESDRPSG